MDAGAGYAWGMSFALSAHLAVTWMLTGLIWTIQMLSYPQFLRVGESGFGGYHLAHCWRIGLLVVPLLLVEAATAGWLLWQGQRGLPFLVSVGLMPVVWLSTAVLQAPLHTKLMRGFQESTVQRLVVTNWIRTVAWTVRGVLVCWAGSQGG